MMNEFWFRISDEEEGERIDKQLSVLMDSLSRSYLQKLLKDGAVLVEKEVGQLVPAKANYRVRGDDRIFLTVPEAVLPDIVPENIALDILYEDEHLLVVNKPKGMVVHPAPGHYSGTLVNALLYHCRDSLSGINGVLRPGIVHRIDRDTTGSLLVCKNDFTHNDIAAQLKQHTLARSYEAIVVGNVKNDEGTVDAPIGRHPKERKKMAVTTDGKEAVTHYRVLKRFEKYTYVECRLETGRTHQIRVHMAHLGHPLLGDEVYGKGMAQNGPSGFPGRIRLEGQVLHAKTLGFIHPISQKLIRTEAPLPEYFVKLLSFLSGLG